METKFLQLVNLHPIYTEKIKPLQWAINITNLEDSSSDLSVSTPGIEPLLDSTDGRAKECDAAIRAKKHKGTLLRTDTDKVKKKLLNECDSDIKFYLSQ